MLDANWTKISNTDYSCMDIDKFARRKHGKLVKKKKIQEGLTSLDEKTYN